MVTVPLVLIGAGFGAWLVWWSPVRRQRRAQDRARAALLAPVFDLAELRWWSDEKVQSARIQIGRLVDSAALAAYAQTSADGAGVAQRMAAYRATIAKEWRRRPSPA